jgi:DNA polymerase I-like protein with 3'-5' exonuclease and polymerase domains
MMAACSGDKNLLRDLKAGDFYGSLATYAFGDAYHSGDKKDVESPSFRMYDGSKVGFLLRCYGGGNDKLANALGRDLNFAKETRGRWDSEYHVLAEYERKLNWQPHVVLDSGRICPLWDRYFVTDDGQLILKHDKPSRNALNYRTQGGLADLVNNSIEYIIDEGYSWTLRMLVHDEVVGCAPIERAEEVRLVYERAMTRVYRGVQFTCDADIEGPTWTPQKNTGFDLTEIKELADVD